MRSTIAIVVALQLLGPCTALLLPAVARPHAMPLAPAARMSPVLMKGKKGVAKPKGSKGRGQQEKASVKNNRLNEATKEFMFTILKLTKNLPDGSRTLIKDINLCFFRGVKIGLVGLNGAGKSTLLRIMAGVDTEFDGTCKPADGISIGYLPQEPTLEGATVGESIDMGVAAGRGLLNKFEELSAKMCEPLDDDAMQAAMDELAAVQDKIEAGDLWELDRVVERASLALRCPPNDADVNVLSGGEKRRVALARLLLENHDSACDGAHVTPHSAYVQPFLT